MCVCKEGEGELAVNELVRAGYKSIGGGGGGLSTLNDTFLLWLLWL